MKRTPPSAATTDEELEAEASLATEMLQGKVVKIVKRHRQTEILVEFTDGTRLFVNRDSAGLELSIG